MSLRSYKSFILLLIVACAFELALAWDLGWKYFDERMSARTVWDTMVGYDTTRNRLGDMGIEDDIAYLSVFRRNKLLSRDTALNLIMDQERKRIIHDIIQDLTKKTGNNLGDDPDVWIEKFGRGSTNSAFLPQRVP